MTGLTAKLTAGKLNLGNGTLTLNITGTPTSSGIASFTFELGTKTCTLQRTILPTPPTPTWATGTIFCNGTPTVVVNVTNPITGKTWMDRNLGASQVATSSTNSSAYGDLYQWGRGADGHQCRNSVTTNILSATDKPNHANIILAPNSPYDWRSPQNINLWQGVNGVNNPCPSGYRIPTFIELEDERTSWSQNNIFGAFNSPLKFCGDIGYGGTYWCSLVNSVYSFHMNINNSDAYMDLDGRAACCPVRCIKD